MPLGVTGPVLHAVRRAIQQHQLVAGARLAPGMKDFIYPVQSACDYLSRGCLALRTNAAPEDK